MNAFPELGPAPLAFITGASSGIGQALALRCYQAGWSLAMVARRGASMAQWAAEQGLDASRYAIYEADVADTESIIAAAQSCMQQQGLPDLVVANAGVSWGVDTARREDLDVMQQVLQVNVLGVAATFHPFIEPMRKRGSGRMVGVASVAGLRGLPGHAAYCSSKAAAIAYCESLRGELRGTGVSVLTLLPGYVDTQLTKSNQYAMPFLLSPEAFAEKAWHLIQSSRSYAIVPWQMAWVGRLMKIIPNALLDLALENRTRKNRHLETLD
ncbi:SDR family oxidoreductase [Comamonas composti]|uniref:SDR family oxidoreductase n=1 Tax=Comamonas composti TaxID=408558 RepID=UPI00047AFDDB|nr:SDR family oxidoreductase [Comamonas composti]